MIVGLVLLAGVVLAGARKGVVVGWDLNPPEDQVTYYKIHVGTQPRVYLTNWSSSTTGMVLLLKNIPEITNQTAVFLVPDAPGSTNMIRVTNNIVDWPHYHLQWDATNFPAYTYWSATAVAMRTNVTDTSTNVFEMESDFSNELVITNRPAPPSGWWILGQLNYQQVVGFTNLTAKFNIDYSSNLTEWKRALAVAALDTNLLPSRLGWWVPEDHLGNRAFWRMVAE